MSLIAIGMNVLLAGLLVAAMVVGLRLNKRLKALRDSHEGFEAAVVQLNLAAQRAEQGLADLRAATDEATDLLSDRIEKGRALAIKLEKLVAAAPELPRAAAPAPERMPRAQTAGLPPVTPPARPNSAEERLGALLSMARSRLARRKPPWRRRPPRRKSPSRWWAAPLCPAAESPRWSTTTSSRTRRSPRALRPGGAGR
jgi:hypothetical protein